MMKAFITKLKIASDIKPNERMLSPKHYITLEQINKSCEHYLLEMEEEQEHMQADLIERGYSESDAYKMWRAM